MNDSQSKYERDIAKYAKLVFGVDEFSLLSKLTLYDGIHKQFDRRRESLWKIEPLLFYLYKSLEQDTLLTLAKFF